MMPERVTFLTGATGFVGSRLLAALHRRGAPVRALTRDASRLNGWAEVVEGSIDDTDLLRDALGGVSVAYYLVHSLGTSDFGTVDREAARSFAAAAADAGVERIVYLGGLGRGELSPHLASRQEVGQILHQSGVPTVELRASVVVGDGSVSYDTFRALASLPLTVLPDWVENPSQPIAIADVVDYLLAAADAGDGGVYEIGGADAVPYGAILEALGGTVVTVPTPGATATLASLFKPLQPERARVVADLLDSLRCDTSVHDERALRTFAVQPMGLHEAIANAATRP